MASAAALLLSHSHFSLSPASNFPSLLLPSPHLFKPFRISCISSPVDSSNSSAVLEKPSSKSKVDEHIVREMSSTHHLSAITLADGLDYARCLFSHFPSPDHAFMYNTLIRGFSESEQPHYSLIIFCQMRRHVIPPDSFSFAFLLKAVANFKSACMLILAASAQQEMCLVKCQNQML